MISNFKRQTALGLVMGLWAPLGSLAHAQDMIWAGSTYAGPDGGMPSAHMQVGPFAFDFFCESSHSDTAQPIFLSIATETQLNGRWLSAIETEGFDGRGLLRAGDLVVGDLPSQGMESGRQVLLTLTPSGYDLGRLLSEQDLSINFEDVLGLSTFDLSVPGQGIGQSLCPIVQACGHDPADLCSIFTVVEPASTDAIPLEGSATRTTDGQPKWFKSEYQTSLASLPYFKTASIFDDTSGSELHISCLVEGGEALALNFVAGPGASGPGENEEGPFAGQAGDSAELVWETGDKAGRWTQFIPFGDGYGMGREGIPADLLTRATLEALMTTDQSITFVARQGTAQAVAEFSEAGSRDAICPVMNACDIPLGFSPACASRK